MSLVFIDQATPTGAQNGVNQIFTLPQPPNPSASLQLWLNGVLQQQGVDYTLAGALYTYAFAFPVAGTVQLASYRYESITPATSSLLNVNDLLRSSFRCIGQLRPGFGHSPSELIDALFILNAMLDSWSVDDLNAYCELIQAFPLTPGIQVYSIGPSGTFNGSRPTKVDKATLVVLTNPVQPLRLDLELIDDDRWQLINLQQTASTLPQKLFYNPTTPMGTIKIWPSPTAAHQVEISSSQTLSAGFASGTDAFTAPPGYLDAVRYHLAIRLAMEWDKPLKPGIMMLATEALAKIQRLNAQTPQMDVNPGVMPARSGRGSFSRLTGD